VTTTFEMPSFTLWKVAFTAIGVSIYWGVQGRTKLKPFLLPDVLPHLPSERAQAVLEFFVFLAMGCIVGIAFTNPTNAQQAITAGMGWTGVLVKRRA